MSPNHTVADHAISTKPTQHDIQEVAVRATDESGDAASGDLTITGRGRGRGRFQIGG